jgi:predicted permease
MVSALIELLPVYIFLFIGWLLRRLNVVDERAPSFLIRFGFFVIAPAVIFNALSRVDPTSTLIAFPIFASLAGIVGYLSGKYVTHKFSFLALRKPVVIMSCLFVNAAFTLVFVTASFGDSGAARVILFNVINLPVVYGFGHLIAAHANPKKHEEKHVAKKLLASTPLWALVLGPLVNVLNVDTPAAVYKVTDAIALLVVPVAATAIGMCFSFARHDMRDSFIVMATRYATGIILAVIVVLAFGLEGIDRAVALALGTAPIGFSTLTFAHLENLDAAFAAKTLGASFLISTVLTSGVLIVFG